MSRLKRLSVQPLIRELIALSRVDALVEGSEPKDAEFAEHFLATTPPDELVPPPLLTGDDDKATDELLENAFVLPDSAMRDVQPVRQPAEAKAP